jgi:ribosomal protein S18 acetylase RimI-like enzyme
VTVRGQVAVRRARHEDWPAVEALLREIDRQHAALAPGYFRVATRDASEWRRLLGDTTALALVAVGERGTPCGFLLLRIFDTPADPTMVPRRRGHLETLVVAGALRRLGIGRQLLAEGTAWARGQGAVEMILTTWAGNTEADAFYQRTGYQVLSRVLHLSI